MLKIKESNNLSLEFEIGDIEDLENFNNALATALGALGTEQGRQMCAEKKVDHYVYRIAHLLQASQLNVELFREMQRKENEDLVLN